MIAMFVCIGIVLIGCSGSSGGDDDEDHHPLAAPIILDTEINGNFCTITWSSVNPAEYYLIYRETSPTAAFDEAIANIPAGNMSWTDSPLEYGVTYYYKIRATASNRVPSPLSALITAVIEQTANLTTPVFYSWSSTDTTVTLTWSATTDDSDRYILYRDTSSTGSFTQQVATIYKPDTSWTDTGLSPSTTYWYKIMARSADGEISELSPAYYTTTTDSGGGVPGTDHSWSEVSTAMSAYTNGLMAAAMTTDSTQTAYNAVSGDFETATYYFNGYESSGYTLTGNLTYIMDTFTYNGTVNYTGGDVASVAFNNYVVSPLSGSLDITFTDGSLWRFDYSDMSWTEQ